MEKAFWGEQREAARERNDGSYPGNLTDWAIEAKTEIERLRLVDASAQDWCNRYYALADILKVPPGMSIPEVAKYHMNKIESLEAKITALREVSSGDDVNIDKFLDDVRSIIRG